MADERDEGPELPAGDFSAWMTEMQAALRGERGAGAGRHRPGANATQVAVRAIEDHEGMVWRVPPER